MICNLTNEPMSVHGQGLLVTESQRATVEAGIAEIGIRADWAPSTGKAAKFQGGNAQHQGVEVWSVVMFDRADGGKLQSWLDAQPG